MARVLVLLAGSLMNRRPMLTHEYRLDQASTATQDLQDLKLDLIESLIHL